MDRNFGRQFKLEHFHLDESITHCNHGSYGAVPKPVYARKQQLQLEIESTPDKWFRYTSFDEWTTNKQCLADYLKVDTDNILICDNATESINAALKSIDFNGSQDAILTTQYTYKAIANSVDYISKYRMSEDNHVQVFQVPCQFPTSKERILREFEKKCDYIINEKKLRLRCVLVDHISSATATLFPVKELVQIVRKLTQNMDTLVMVDGAHAIGQIELNLVDLDCDYYISNLHKWFLAPRGCSFLYLKDRKKLEKNLQPNYISHGYDKDLNYNFYRRGTADKSSFFCIRQCVKFYEETLGGLSTIQSYANKILQQAVDMCVQAWDTSELGLTKELKAPYMRLVELPYMKGYRVTDNEPAIDVVNKLQRDVLEKHKIITVIVYVQDTLFIRLSCFVYNEIGDFEKLRDAILDLRM